MWRAGPQLRSCECSVAWRTSTRILWVQCGMPDLNRDPASSVWRAGSAAILWSQCCAPDLNRDPVSSVWRAGPQLDMSEKNVRRYVRKNVKRYVGKNVRRYVRKNVRRYVRKNVRRYGRKNVRRYVRKNVRRYVRKNVKRYVRKHVRRYARKNVKSYARRFVRKTVKRYVRKNVKRFVRKNVKRYVRKNVGRHVRRYARKNVKSYARRFVRKTVKRYVRQNVRRCLLRFTGQVLVGHASQDKLLCYRKCSKANVVSFDVAHCSKYLWLNVSCASKWGWFGSHVGACGGTSCNHLHWHVQPVCKGSWVCVALCLDCSWTWAPSTTHAGDCMFIVPQVVEGTVWHVVYEGRAVPNEEGEQELEQRAPVFRTLASFWEVRAHEWQTNAVPSRASYTEEVQEAQWQASDFMVCARHDM